MNTKKESEKILKLPPGLARDEAWDLLTQYALETVLQNASLCKALGLSPSTRALSPGEHWSWLDTTPPIPAKDAFKLGFVLGRDTGRDVENKVESAIKSRLAQKEKERQRADRDPIKGTIRQAFMRLKCKVPEVLKGGEYNTKFQGELRLLGIGYDTPERDKKKSMWRYHFFQKKERGKKWNPLESSLETLLYGKPKPHPA